ncbi:MAG: alpha/beta hydrolase [Treponema sp.]|nr:alpha/beta hydrolase [Treponema sp.]MBQ4237190.1 alpha/beta hydrolase [Treponema sp.]
MVLKIILIALGIIALLNVIVFVFLPPFIIYRILLVRTKPEKWGRKCSDTKDKEQMTMFAEGEEWGESYKDFREEVSIESAGFKLAAQYFDFGNDKACIVIAGRSESCLYSCYFAEPYRKMGYNLLLLDNRCHGLSEGKYNTTGFTEYVDVLAWGKFLHEKKNMKSVICHGICMGAAAALYAMVDESCPDYMQGLVSDGLFTTFRDSFYNHLVKDKHLTFPTTPVMMLLLKRHAHADTFHDGPIARIQNYKKPILFLYSREDKFSLPEEAERLYEKCRSPKKLVWFDKGVHSHVRINNKEKYDQAICDFVQEYFK